MDYSFIGTSISILLLVSILIGAGIGALRGWSKSLIRLCVVLFASVLTVLLTPIISKAMLNINLSGLNIVINGTQITTLASFIAAMLGNYGVDSATLEAMPAFSSLINNLPLLILNVIVYIIFFLLALIFTLIIYGILVAIFMPKRKRAVMPKRRWLGAILGAVQGLIVFVVLFMPTVGLISTCEDCLNVISSETSVQTDIESANNYGEENNNIKYVADTNTGENSDGEVVEEKGLSELNAIIEQYNNSVGLKVLNVFGYKNISNWTYDNLTTIKIDGESTKLRTEIIGVAKIAKTLDEVGDITKKDLSDEEIEKLKNAVNQIYDSKLLGKVVCEVIPVATKKWSNNEKFLIDKPTVDDADLQPVVDSMILSFSKATANTLRNDTLNLVDMLAVCGKYNVMSGLQNGNDILKIINKSGFITDFVSTSLSSSVLKESFPELLNYGMKQVYKTINLENYTQYEITKKSSDLTSAEWEQEKQTIGELLESIISFTVDLSGLDKVEISNINISVLGKVFDNIRKSIFLGSHSKDIVVGILNSDFVNKDGAIPQAFIDKVKSDWDTINFIVTFNIVQASLDINTKIQEGKNLSSDDMKNFLENIGEEGIGEVINSLASKENLEKMGMSGETANAVNETINNVINTIKDQESVDYAKEAKAMETLMKTFDTISKNNEKPEEEKSELITTENVDDIVNSLVDSNVILDAMTKESGSISKTIQDNATVEQKILLEDSLNAKKDELVAGGNVTEEDKTKLEKVADLFGLTSWSFD